MIDLIKAIIGAMILVVLLILFPFIFLIAGALSLIFFLTLLVWAVIKVIREENARDDPDD